MSTLKATNIQNASSATTNIALDTSGNVTVGGGITASSGTVVMSSPYTMRNLIINGAMQVWQRGTSFTDPTAGGNFYTADRWGANRAGDATGITISRSTSAPSGFQYSLALQRTAGNSGVAGLYLFYSNETVNSIQYQGQSIVLSFYAKAGANYSGGSLSLNVNTGTGTDQRVYAYTGSSTIISSSQSITTTWTRYTFTGTVPSNATEIGFNINWTPTGTAGADDAIYITGVQLERGAVATPFEYRNYQQELAMCQRYYQKSSGSNLLAYDNYNVVSASCFVTGFYPVQMRTTPTGSFSAIGDFTFSNTNSGNFVVLGRTSFTYYIGTDASASARCQWYTANSNAAVIFSAEL